MSICPAGLNASLVYGRRLFTDVNLHYRAGIKCQWETGFYYQAFLAQKQHP